MLGADLEPLLVGALLVGDDDEPLGLLGGGGHGADRGSCVKEARGGRSCGGAQEGAGKDRCRGGDGYKLVCEGPERTQDTHGMRGKGRKEGRKKKRTSKRRGGKGKKKKVGKKSRGGGERESG